MSPSLAERLKTETRTLHTTVERGTFMSALLHGQLSRNAYCTLLRNLHALYQMLESMLERHAQAPEIAVIYEPALWRTRALADDLAVLHGSHWLEELPLARTAADYVERLRELGGTQQAHRLLSHAYVRYLGDLSGGQLLRDVALRTLAEPRAVTFYEFGDRAQTSALRTAFRAGLDKIALRADEAEELIEEAKNAFQRHELLFDELRVLAGPDPGLRGYAPHEIVPRIPSTQA